MHHTITTHIFLASVIVCLAVISPISAAESDGYPRALISTSLGDITIELYPDSAPRSVEIFLGLAEGKRPWRDPESEEMVTRPYYDGTIFHRVIKDFMIQGGDILGTGHGGAGFTFADEINAAGLGLDTTPAISNGQPHPHIAGLPNVIAAIRDHYIVPRLNARGVSRNSPPAQQQRAIHDILEELDGQLSIQDLYETMGYRYDDELIARPPVAGSLCLANRGPNTNAGQFFINVTDTPHLQGLHTVFGHVIAGMDVVHAISESATDEQARPTHPVTIISVRRIDSDDSSQERPEE
ncbi:MAG: peptidylprolyl isomerase [Planctomycetota bacterium]|nr:MAG: peptidylprolyl isomerase [Planctomycetota bacterium]